MLKYKHKKKKQRRITTKIIIRAITNPVIMDYRELSLLNSHRCKHGAPVMSAFDVCTLVFVCVFVYVRVCVFVFSLVCVFFIVCVFLAL